MLVDPPPCTPRQAPDPKEERRYLEWINQRLHEEIRTRWTQIEGVHSRALALMTLLTGFAAFTFASVKPLAPWQIAATVVALFVPAAGAIAVLRPRERSELEVDNLLDSGGHWLTPANLGEHLRELAIERGAELNEKGRWLGRAYLLALCGLILMLTVLAVGAVGARSVGKPEPAPSPQADSPGTSPDSPASQPANAPGTPSQGAGERAVGGQSGEGDRGPPAK